MKTSVKTGMILTAFLLLIGGTPLSAQTVRNPTQVEFTSADHANAAVTGYELDIVRKSDNVVIQTLDLGKPASVGTGTDGHPLVRTTINVQPINFGLYYSLARTVAGVVESSNSLPSNDWERVPGAPSRPIMAIRVEGFVRIWG